jgi:hypothetical protein
VAIVCKLEAAGRRRLRAQSINVSTSRSMKYFLTVQFTVCGVLVSAI